MQHRSGLFPSNLGLEPCACNCNWIDFKFVMIHTPLVINSFIQRDSLGSRAAIAGMMVLFASQPYPHTLPPPLANDLVAAAAAAAHGQLPAGQPEATPHGQLLGGVQGQQFVDVPLQGQ